MWVFWSSDIRVLVVHCNAMAHAGQSKLQPLDLTSKSRPNRTGCKFDDTSVDLIQKGKVVTAERQLPRACAVAKPGGWVMAGQTVVPYLWRGGHQYLSVSVLRYGAGLLSSVPSTCVPSTKAESLTINQMCRSVGIKFNFKNNTPLISLRNLTAINALTASMLTVLSTEDLSHVGHHPLHHGHVPHKVTSPHKPDSSSSSHSFAPSTSCSPPSVETKKTVHRRKRKSHPQRIINSYVGVESMNTWMMSCDWCEKDINI